MAKDPAFLFYPGDFNTGTQFFTDDQVGKYMRLLMAQHQHGHLTQEQVLHICKSYDKHVMAKFVQDSDGLWFNERLETEILKRKNFVKSRSENRTKGKNISKTHEQHVENKNENRIDNEIIKKSKLEIFEELFSDDIFISDLSRTHRDKDLKQAFEECYIHHSNAPNPPQALWQWKQKFNTWLTIKKTEKKNGKGFTDKRTEHIEGLIDDFNKR